jgi:hypothetical protein
MDLDGLSTGHMSRTLIGVFRQLNDCDAANYPEMIGDIHIVNVGWFFRTLWAVILPLIDTTTAMKVHVHSGAGYEDLRRAIGADRLPTELGGTVENAMPYRWLRMTDGAAVFT